MYSTTISLRAALLQFPRGVPQPDNMFAAHTWSMLQHAADAAVTAELQEASAELQKRG